MNAQHLATTAEHGTPPEYVELGRYVLGEIDGDPASSSYWNHHIVKAKWFHDERSNGLLQPWRGRLWLNPPGGDDPQGRGLVRQFWERLVGFWREGIVHSAVWMGYSLEQLVNLQSCPFHPLQLFNVVPPSRIAFMFKPPGGGPPERSKSPTHGNYLTLLHTRTSNTVGDQQARRFVERASALGLGGAIVRPI